jgi:phenylphosphate carboxylase alpha subunit
MPFKDLREFIARLEKEGEAVRIEDEIDWNLEAGALLRRAVDMNLPAPFCQKIKGYPEGYRIFGGSGANLRRIAIAMDMATDTHPKKIIDEFLRRKHQPIPPVLVSDGPCKENIHIGDKVDLLEFPVPLIHGGDGGRYIGTWHAVIAKDPTSNWVNWGMYRLMLQNKNTTGLMVASPVKHLWSIYSQNYLPKNKPMEVAVAIGMEPISSFCAQTYTTYGLSEVDLAGGLRGEPVELVKCETVDLKVPATAEIIIEGEIRPGDIMMDEGPFGEYTGYRACEKAPRPIIRVKAVTHRNNPILTMSCNGVPGHDDTIHGLTKAAELQEALNRRGLPVTGVCLFPETCWMLAAVAVKVPYAHVAEDIAHVIWGTHQGPSIPYIVVVEDDVDPFNFSEVMHALVSKCHPYKGIVRMEHSPIIALIPFLSKQEQRNRSGARVFFDCTWPRDWDPEYVPQKVSFKTIFPPEVQEKVLAIWRKTLQQPK